MAHTPAARRPDPMFPFQTVVLGAFVPTFMFEMGMGALLPVIPTTVTHLGGSLATAAVIATLIPLGQLVMNVPAGILATKYGDRRAMIVAGGVAGLAFAAAGIAPHLVTLAVAVVLLGGATAVFTLARQSYLTEVTAPLRRARVLSTLAGVHRIGQFAGPFAGAAIIHWFGPKDVLWLGVVTSLLAALVVVIAREDARATAHAAAEAADRPSLRVIFRENLALLTSLGLACLLIGAVRSVRQTAIPLWAEHLGLHPEVASLVVGLAGGVDMLLFYPAGKVMDRMGRNWIGIPAMLTMGAALIALPFTQTFWPFAIVSMLVGLGNGMSSGILMTLGADAAPTRGRAQFLGLWRTLQDSGAVIGPLIVSAGAALGSLAAGVWAAGVIGPAAAAALFHWTPRWTVHANRTTRRNAGITP